MREALRAIHFEWLVVGLTMGIAIAITFFEVTAEAYWYPFRWEDSSADACDDTSDYLDEAADAAHNFNDDTDLTVTFTTSCAGWNDMQHIQSNYGNTGWTGFSYMYHDGQPCFNYGWTGNCGPSDPADFVYIIWNDYYAPLSDTDWQARHEMGHAFGMEHPNETECSGGASASVMFSGEFSGCLTKYSSLQQYDIDELDSEY